MTNNRTSELEYQFTAVPTNLFLCLDNNCRSMLFTLIQLSTYYAKEDGFFFRANEDLQAESNLSENLVRATLSSLYDNGLILVSSVGKNKGTIPNNFKVNFENFVKWENLSIEECMKNPIHKIETANYKHKGFMPSYLTGEETKEKKEVSHNFGKSEHNIDNINNVENIDNSDNAKNKNNNNSKNSMTIGKENNFDNIPMTFDNYKAQENNLMNKLYNAKNNADFDLYSKELIRLMSQCTHEGWVARTRKRYEKIKAGKEKFFATLYFSKKQNAAVEERHQANSSFIDVSTNEVTWVAPLDAAWAAILEKNRNNPKYSKYLEAEAEVVCPQELPEERELDF